ncbi:hypothetical protein ABDD95_22380 [Mucilaginibacter sp. PAMB04274]|uniref:hypothetical protein n=1 Tax=Mucilaginibacter sp. PAMB04274 TaxID=3138568 RepID=UPI0031F641E0
MKSFTSYYLGYIVPASTLLPIVAGLMYYKRINKPLHTLLIYLIIAFIINVIGSVMAGNHINNLPLLHFYTIFELLAVMFYYKHAFGHGKITSWIYAAMIAFPLLCVLNFTFLQSLHEFNTYTRPLGALIIILFSGLYLAVQPNLSNQQLVTRSGRMVAGGFLIYFCSSLFQFIFSNVVSHIATRTIKDVIWNLHATFVLVMYLFFFAAILNERNKR